MLGEQFSGPMSDFFGRLYTRRTNRIAAPSQRLAFAQVGNILIIVGLVVFLVEIKNAGSHWNIRPDIGVGIAAFGCQMVATPCVTCMSDPIPSFCHLMNHIETNLASDRHIR
jgi:hypothetical protein